MGTLDLDNYYLSVFLAANQSADLMCSGITELNSQLAHISGGQCLMFCDYTPYVAMTPVLNNTQDLDLNCLADSFPVQ